MAILGTTLPAGDTSKRTCGHSAWSIRTAWCLQSRGSEECLHGQEDLRVAIVQSKRHTHCSRGRVEPAVLVIRLWPRAAHAMLARQAMGHGLSTRLGLGRTLRVAAVRSCGGGVDSVVSAARGHVARSTAYARAGMYTKKSPSIGESCRATSSRAREKPVKLPSPSTFGPNCLVSSAPSLSMPKQDGANPGKRGGQLTSGCTRHCLMRTAPTSASWPKTRWEATSE